MDEKNPKTNYVQNLNANKNTCRCYGLFKKVNISEIFLMNHDVHVSWFFSFISGKITLICIGPLTNVAVALRLNPDFGKQLKKCVIMGGNTEGTY